MADSFDAPMRLPAIYYEVAERLRAARERTGLTQHELGLATGLGQATVSNLEQGKRKIMVHEAVKLANVLGIDLRDLLLGQVEEIAGETTVTLRITTEERMTVDALAYRRARDRGRVRQLFRSVARRKGVVSIQVTDSTNNTTRWEV